MDLSLGWRIPGYRNLRELGAGAFGRVVLAEDERDGSPVAVKYLAEKLVRDERFRGEFRAEALLLAGLRSEHVVRVREYVETAEGAAIVMDLIDGGSLRKVLDERGPLAPEAALAVLKGSLLGLSDAHRAGVVHRDYKPDNVLVTTEGVSTLVDFGIAVRSGAEAEAGGTPAYMPPERWQRGVVAPAGDVYAATAVFFECLTGRRPYQASTLTELAVLHLQAPVPVEEAPEAVRGLLWRGLAKDPADRPHTGAEFVAELEAVAEAAYGPDWERRGRRLLAMAVVGLTALALSATATSADAPATGQTSMGETTLREGAGSAQGGRQAPGGRSGGLRRRRKSRSLSATSTKIIVACAALSLVACLVVLAVKASGGTDPVANAHPAPGTSSAAPPSDGTTEAPGPSPTDVQAPKMVDVPDVVDAVLADAEAKVRAAGLVPYVKFEQSLKKKPGTVLRTDPGAGTSVRPESLVALVVAQKSPVLKVIVPDVQGSSYAKAQAAILDVGLKPRRVDREVATERRAAAPGEVLSTDPGAGTEVDKGSRVTVYVAKAKANALVPVPDVVRLPRAQAVQTVRDAGLKPTVVTRQSAAVPEGQVISTTPGAGARVTAGSAVTLYVALAPPVPDVTVPNVAGSSYDAAAQTLRAAGLVPERATRQTKAVEAGKAIETDPPAGATVKPGAKVTVYIAEEPPPPPLTISATAAANPATAPAGTYCERGYTFAFSGSISVSRGPVTVTYRWIRSDGAAGPARTLEFTGTGAQTLAVARSTWSLNGGDYTGWEKIQVLTPNAVLSNAADFVYDCRYIG